MEGGRTPFFAHHQKRKSIKTVLNMHELAFARSVPNAG